MTDKKKTKHRATSMKMEMMENRVAPLAVGQGLAASVEAGHSPRSSPTGLGADNGGGKSLGDDNPDRQMSDSEIKKLSSMANAFKATSDTSSEITSNLKP